MFPYSGVALLVSPRLFPSLAWDWLTPLRAFENRAHIGAGARQVIVFREKGFLGIRRSTRLSYLPVIVIFIFPGILIPNFLVHDDFIFPEIMFRGIRRSTRLPHRSDNDFIFLEILNPNFQSLMIIAFREKFFSLSKERIARSRPRSDHQCERYARYYGGLRVPDGQHRICSR